MLDRIHAELDGVVNGLLPIAWAATFIPSAWAVSTMRLIPPDVSGAHGWIRPVQ